MRLEINYIVVLGSDKKYLVVNCQVLSGIPYFLLAGVTDDDNTLTDELLLVTEQYIDGELYAIPVRNPVLVNAFCEALDAEQKNNKLILRKH